MLRTRALAHEFLVGRHGWTKGSFSSNGLVIDVSSIEYNFSLWILRGELNGLDVVIDTGVMVRDLKRMDVLAIPRECFQFVMIYKEL